MASFNSFSLSHSSLLKTVTLCALCSRWHLPTGPHVFRDTVINRHAP